MSAIFRLGLVALVCAASARADETTEFCGLRTASVPDESRAEADERCNRVAGALVATPGPASLAQLTELDAWLAQHRRPPAVETMSCNELVEVRRRAVFRAVDDRLEAEERLLRELERPRRKPPAPTKRHRVRDLEAPF